MSRSRSISDRVDARDGVEELGHAVVRLDLRRVRIELEPERRHDARGELLPVDVGIRDDVRVVVADRAVDLALERHALDRGDLRARAARRRSPSPCRASSASPAGRACARASRRPRARARARAGPRGSPAAAAAARRAARCASDTPCARLLMSSDVHAKWMNSATRGDLRHAGEALLQPVLDRLDVVIGRALDRLDARGIGERRTRGPLRRARAARPRRTAGTSAIAGSSASASSHAISTRTRLRMSAYSLKCGAQRVELVRIAAVERRQRGERGFDGQTHAA